MNAPAVPLAQTGAPAQLRLGVHLLVAVAIGVVSPFTGFAWPFALLVGMILGSSDARRMRGEPNEVAESLAAAVIAAFGFLAMLLFGALVGGIIAIVVVALTAFSEKAAAFASPVDRGVARILLFLVPIVMLVIVFPLIGMNVDVRIGG